MKRLKRTLHFYLAAMLFPKGCTTMGKSTVTLHKRRSPLSGATLLKEGLTQGTDPGGLTAWWTTWNDRRSSFLIEAVTAAHFGRASGRHA